MLRLCTNASHIETFLFNYEPIIFQDILSKHQYISSTTSLILEMTNDGNAAKKTRNKKDLNKKCLKVFLIASICFLQKPNRKSCSYRSQIKSTSFGGCSHWLSLIQPSTWSQESQAYDENGTGSWPWVRSWTGWKASQHFHSVKI